MLQDCPLYGTEECRLLHMTDCESCPLSMDEDTDSVVDRIAIYKRDTEGVDVPGLFTGDACRLCRKEPQKKVGYMLYDLGHTIPNRKPERGWRRLLKGGGPEFDILLPLQFNCCASCRRHIWWDRNLVTVTTLGLVLLTLIPVSIELSVEKLRAVSRMMPLIALVAAVLIGFIGGKLLKKKLHKKWAEETWLKLSEYPVSQTLFSQGWKPALINSSGKETVMFTKKTLDCGLGTAPKAEASAKPEQAPAEAAEPAPAAEEKSDGEEQA